ncbi:MAG TPA: transglutaminase-like domain-containing protein [Candidatus Nanoarchaeia archaeon]|nr:transglutaminase-like domain-containing protein [Candidatus Nanoarchaeia archaeon]
MRRVVLLFILLVASAAGVAAEANGDIYDRQYLIIENSISSTIDIVRQSDQSDLEYVKTTLYFQPIADPRLEVFSLETTPEAERANETLIFEWEGDREGRLKYQVDAKIKTKTVYDLLPNKVKFPLSDIPSEVDKYLSQTESVDYFDANIRRQANQLAEGEDDLYIVVNKVGMWIQENIQYNLSTVTADVSQQASWVMKNRYGVCDEITNLFLAMVRSLGIPARFAAGLAYTNSPLFENKWGPHGWAEVYFPGHGWVPFDITYQQYGWLDPSHIKLRETLDAKDPSQRFEWRGHDIDLKVSPLEMTAEILEKGPKVNYELEILADVIKNSTGFGSHNVVTARIINYNNYYKTTDVTLANTEGLSILDEQSRMVMLKPYEEVKVSWLVKVDDALDGEFTYTFPLMVYTQRNITGQTRFSTEQGEPVFAKQAIEQLRDADIVVEQKQVNSAVDLSCSPLLEQMFPQELNYLNCTITNQGNTALEAVQACYLSECGLVNVLIGESMPLSFTVTDLIVGKNELVVTAKAGKQTIQDTIEVLVLDEPRIEIANVTAPSEVKYEDSYDLSFDLKKLSIIDPVDVEVTLSGGIYEKFHLDSLKGRQRIIIESKGAHLWPGKNDIAIDVLYHDNKFKRFTEKASTTVTLKDVSLTQRIMTYLNRFGLWISRFWEQHRELMQEE